MAELNNATVVITGASSGIGRAAAQAFAQRGANLVLAARRGELLDSLAAECSRLGTRAAAVPTDVTDAGSVEALATEAVSRFGRIDVWVNNAGVGLYGLFTTLPAEAFRRVIETNFFGCVHGSRAALQRFEQQGQGVLINNASIDAVVAAPYMSAYASSKFAVRGFSQSLRQELRGTNIHICTILPAGIDTPFFQHAGNYSGRSIKGLRPTYRAADVAGAMVACAEQPRREVIVGNAGRLLALTQRLMPGLAEYLTALQIERDDFGDEPALPSSGNLFQPAPPGGVSGGWRAQQSQSLLRIALRILSSASPAARAAAAERAAAASPGRPAAARR